MSSRPSRAREPVAPDGFPASRTPDPRRGVSRRLAVVLGHLRRGMAALAFFTGSQKFEVPLAGAVKG
jgi:hypothetical protein